MGFRVLGFQLCAGGHGLTVEERTVIERAIDGPLGIPEDEGFGHPITGLAFLITSEFSIDPPREKSPSVAAKPDPVP